VLSGRFRDRKAIVPITVGTGPSKRQAHRSISPDIGELRAGAFPELGEHNSLCRPERKRRT